MLTAHAGEPDYFFIHMLEVLNDGAHACSHQSTASCTHIMMAIRFRWYYSGKLRKNESDIVVTTRLDL